MVLSAVLACGGGSFIQITGYREVPLARQTIPPKLGTQLATWQLIFTDDDAKSFAVAQIERSMESCSRHMAMVLRDVPVHITLSHVVDQAQLCLQCDWQFADGTIVEQRTDVAKTHFNYMADVHTTLSGFQDQAYEVLNMWEAPNINEYLIDPLAHRRELAKVIREVKNGYYNQAQSTRKDGLS